MIKSSHGNDDLNIWRLIIIIIIIVIIQRRYVRYVVMKVRETLEAVIEHRKKNTIYKLYHAIGQNVPCAITHKRTTQLLAINTFKVHLIVEEFFA